MAKRLINMSWDEVQSEMSIAGSPEKIGAVCKDAWYLIEGKIDGTNYAELANVEFGLKRMLAEIKSAQRTYNKSH